eukprot:6213959-Pleurochrysis_carterae.AAC.2
MEKIYGSSEVQQQHLQCSPEWQLQYRQISKYLQSTLISTSAASDFGTFFREVACCSQLQSREKARRLISVALHAIATFGSAALTGPAVAAQPCQKLRRRGCQRFWYQHIGRTGLTLVLRRSCLSLHVLGCC